MIRLFGDISLIFALVFSLLQSVLPLIGYYSRKNPYLLACARPSAWGQFICILIAYILLTTAFATNTFSIAYVAANSHASLPLMYRLTAVWGAHEGSILLWILILSGWTVAYSMSLSSRNVGWAERFLRSPTNTVGLRKKRSAQPTFRDDSARHDPLTLAILGLISFSFLCFLLLTSNPFLPATVPQLGQDLNPLLQDPGFIIHPPMLYMGYVGFSVAFAITLSALIRDQLDKAWAQLTHRFAIAAWCFLTLGITLGSWWAYRVLGWGGFWFWDPVENASLLPWLSGTALIHVLILSEKRNTAKSWASLLALISFALSVLGTFLVRSGVLISAHTFANDPARGVFLLLLLAILVTAALAVYVIRLPILSTSHGVPFSWLSRETALLLNSALLLVAMMTILLGTLYPLILDAFHLGTISVGAPYFNLVMTPLVLILMAFMGFGPLCRWEKQAIYPLFQQARKKMLISLITSVTLLWSITGQLEIIAIISLMLNIWIIMSILGSIRLLPGMSLAHSGFAVMVIGIMLSGLLSEEREVRMHPGNAVNIGPYQFFFIDTQRVTGANYIGIRAAFDVIKNKHHVTHLYPEKRKYTVRDMVMTTVDIHPGIFRDLYIALGEPLNENDWSVRIYYKPFIRWVWLGGVMMMLGGLWVVIQRRELGSVQE